MIKTKICTQCGRWLSDAVEAMRDHETDMLLCLRLNREDQLTEDLREKLKPGLVSSFSRAQAAWDGYRRHLDEHGLLVLAEACRKAP